MPGAEKLEHELNSYLGLAHGPTGGPEIVHTVASEGKGIEEALEAAREYQPRARRMHAAEIWSARLREMLRERLLDRLPAEDFSRPDAKWPSTAAIRIRFSMTGSNELKSIIWASPCARSIRR